MIDARSEGGELGNQTGSGSIESPFRGLEHEDRDRHYVMATAQAVVAERLIAVAGLLRVWVRNPGDADVRHIARIHPGARGEQEEKGGDAVESCARHGCFIIPFRGAAPFRAPNPASVAHPGIQSGVNYGCQR